MEAPRSEEQGDREESATIADLTAGYLAGDHPSTWMVPNAGRIVPEVEVEVEDTIYAWGPPFPSDYADPDEYTTAADAYYDMVGDLD